MFGLDKNIIDRDIMNYDINELLDMGDFDVSDIDITDDEINQMFASDNFNMAEVGINNDGINKMIAEMEKTETPIERKTPEMIEKNPDPVDRERELVEFTWLHNLYITPLSEMAKRICLKLNLSYSEIPSFSNLSIMGRMSKLRDFLISKGCTIDHIISLVPKTEKEIEVLAHASKYGFDLGFDGVANLTNDNRILRAKNYLVSNVIKSQNGDQVGNFENRTK